MTLQQGVGGAPPPATVAAAASATPAVRTRTEERASSSNRLVSRIVYIGALIIATIVFVFPFVWLLSASLKTRADVFSNEFIILPLQFHNYSDIFAIAPITSWFVNSVIVGVLAAVTVTISSASSPSGSPTSGSRSGTCCSGSSWPA